MQVVGRMSKEIGMGPPTCMYAYIATQVIGSDDS